MKPILHVSGQAKPNDSVLIGGTREGLESLKLAINKALCKEEHVCEKVQTSDEEEYNLIVRLKDNLDTLPYTEVLYRYQQEDNYDDLHSDEIDRLKELIMFLTYRSGQSTFRMTKDLPTTCVLEGKIWPLKTCRRLVHELVDEGRLVANKDSKHTVYTVADRMYWLRYFFSRSPKGAQ